MDKLNAWGVMGMAIVGTLLTLGSIKAVSAILQSYRASGAEIYSDGFSKGSGAGYQEGRRDAERECHPKS